MSYSSEMNADMNSDFTTTIFVVSGGTGFVGNNVVHSVLVRFPDNKVPIVIIRDVDSRQKVQNAVSRAKEAKGLIVHTMIDPIVREMLVKLCEREKVKHFDPLGGLSDYLSILFRRNPISNPVLYNLRNMEYFRRVEAVEFIMKHDDGLNSEQLSQADIILCGVSRTGKTPLSIYMGMFGWKVANVPLVPGIDPPESLWNVDNRRVFGLTTSTPYLKSQRNNRMAQLGLSEDDDYINPRKVREELEYSNRIFKEGNFTVFNITNKPIESTANEILTRLTDRFGVNDYQHIGEI